MSRTYGINYTSRQKLVNLTYQIIVRITTSMYLGQDAGDGLQRNHYYCVLQHNLLISYMELVIEFVDVNGLKHIWVEHNS